MQHQTVLAVQMTIGSHQQRAEWQRLHLIACVGFILQHKNIGKAFAYERQHGRIFRRHPVRQRRESCRRRDRCAAVFNI